MDSPTGSSETSFDGFLEDGRCKGDNQVFRGDLFVLMFDDYTLHVYEVLFFPAFQEFFNSKV